MFYIVLLHHAGKVLKKILRRTFMRWIADLAQRYSSLAPVAGSTPEKGHRQALSATERPSHGPGIAYLCSDRIFSHVVTSNKTRQLEFYLSETEARYEVMCERSGKRGCCIVYVRKLSFMHEKRASPRLNIRHVNSAFSLSYPVGWWKAFGPPHGKATS